MEKVQIREEYAPKLMIQQSSKERGNILDGTFKEFPLSLDENILDVKQTDNIPKSVSLILENSILLSKKMQLIEEHLLQLQIENSKLKELVLFSKLQIDKLSFDYEELQTSIQEQLRKSKNEYISALQCEMEISRNIISRELQRYSGNSSLKGHGDPFFV
jgi:hypothetical protein